MSNKEHPNNLKRELKKAGRTQKWLKEQLSEQGVEFSTNHISQIVLGNSNTTTGNWIKIADLLETSLDALLRTDIS